MDDHTNGLNSLGDHELDFMAQQIEMEKQRRAQRSHQVAEENLVAAAYHRQVSAEMHNGVPIWVKPQLPMMGYFSGAVVWHAGEGWQNDQPDVNLTEPGDDGHTWTSWADAGTWVGDNPPWEEAAPIEEVEALDLQE